MSAPTQYQIETAVGIDEAIAKHMMAEETQSARNAMGLLKLCCASFEDGAFALLKCAVADCKREVAAKVSA